MINNEMVEDPEIWNLPEGFYNQIKGHITSKGKNLIDLEPTVQSDGSEVKTLAVEGDWHDIPSIRGILKHDIKLAKRFSKSDCQEVKKVPILLSKNVSKRSFRKSMRPSKN